MPSSRLATIVGAGPLLRSDVVEAVLRYVRAHDCYAPLDNRVILADATLHHVFACDRMAVADLQAMCSGHLRAVSQAEAAGEAPGLHEPSPAAGPLVTRMERPTGARSFNGTEKVVMPKAAMAAIVGVGPVLRMEAVARLWRYIHGHNLLDPADRLMVIADDWLRAVYGRDRIAVGDLEAELPTVQVVRGSRAKRHAAGVEA